VQRYEFFLKKKKNTRILTIFAPKLNVPMNKTRISIVILYLLQIFLTFKGVGNSNKYIAPILLFSVSLAIPLYFLYVLLRKQLDADENQVETKGENPFVAAFIGLFTIFLAYEALRKTFVKYANFATLSDVVPQINALYFRWKAGENPYYELPEYAWHPFPVYMPLHWLPLKMTDLLNCDTRWAGYIVLMIATGIFAYLMAQHNKNKYTLWAAIMLPSIALWAYIKWGEGDIPVTYELNIAGYYLLLAVALATRNFYWTLIGLICCLLSRYTMVFWMPLLGFIFLKEYPLKKSMLFLGVVVASVVVLYIIPFIAKDPTILSKGLHYHNFAAIEDWRENPWTTDKGVSFTIYMKEHFTGNWEERVFKSRIVQAVLMLSLLFSGLYLYFRRWANQINPYDFLLAMLHITVLFFYNFGPLTYRYYLISMMMLSAVVCSRVVALRFEK
jgi:hypothetical protein